MRKLINELENQLINVKKSKKKIMITTKTNIREMT